RSEADVVNAIKGIYPLVLQYQSALRLREAVPENGQRLSSRKRCTSRNCDFILNDAPEYQHLDEQGGQQLSDLISNDVYFIDKNQEWTPRSRSKLLKLSLFPREAFHHFYVRGDTPERRGHPTFRSTIVRKCALDLNCVII
uniref:CAP10 domain-containing protein n=1 Tax=Ascaris lumbricoides TaxID=6252 RepID=A0A0M3ISX7_ASCLU